MVQTTKRTCFPQKRSEEEVIQILKQNPLQFAQYQRFNDDWKRRFMDYCMGKKTLPITYDPFFKRLFNPDIYPGRLSRFLSCVLGQKIHVLKVLSNEDTMLDGGTLLIMDILVQLADGSLVDVEIQKIPYLFPGPRMCCYSADLLLRQYSRVKGERGTAFTYDDIKNVYVIVIFEKSIEMFHGRGLGFIHRGENAFDTGLPMELLQKYILIALDVFRKNKYAKDRSELNGWISLLAVENVEEAEELLADYPWLEEIYRDMAEFMQRPEEVLGMFSEALRILDHNTILLMIDEQKQETERWKQEAERKTQEAERKAQEAERKTQEAEKQKRETERLKQENEKLKQEIEQLSKR